MVAGWLGLDGPWSKLSAYEVGVSFLLLRFAEDQTGRRRAGRPRSLDRRSETGAGQPENTLRFAAGAPRKQGQNGSVADAHSGVAHIDFSRCLVLSCFETWSP